VHLAFFLRATCSHLILVDLITMIIFGEILHCVTFSILLTLSVSVGFGHSPQHPVAQPIDRPTRLRAGRPDNQSVLDLWAGARDSSALQIVQISPGARIASYSVDNGAPY
jgi:hypothetical protein